MDEADFGFLVGVIATALFGGVFFSILNGNPATTTTYTLEDGTVLHDCWDGGNTPDCGMHLSDCKETGVEYKCQKNVKITTEAKSATLNAKNVKTFMEQNGCTALFTQTFPIGNLACQKNECTSGGYCKYTTKNLIE